MAKKKILIAHGWLHSSKRYERLKEALEQKGGCEVTLYEFPGFGASPARFRTGILKNYVREMKALLRRESFDILIGHSMGGNVLLKAASACSFQGTLILINPEYGGVPLLKLFTPLTPVLFLSLYLAKLPRRFTEPFIRLTALFTVNRPDRVDGRLVEDVRRADPWTAAVLFAELAWDHWRVTETGDGTGQKEVPAAAPGERNREEQRARKRNREEQRARKRNCEEQSAGERSLAVRNLGAGTVLLVSEKDRLLPARHMRNLKRDLGVRSVRVFRGIGHTIVLEDFEELVNVLAKKIKLPPRERCMQEISLQADGGRREEQ